ncbi:hypothetical protein [Pontivivens ytuae]|uniref:Type II toxin-antitoxin system ParD family antitoxin n=1 Tax=Pontivivens ytuae TaxID=2789856 RepID=A0A7S9LU48_9RHOB|nr:hypothetical protein [Pontivivens ytuae]QPH55211.1 hypothetical protein I0K15_05580 [Pontivivens ytuae]
MTVKTTLSFTDRHAAFLKKQVEDGIYASQSAAVAAAIEDQIRAEEERQIALDAMAEEIRRRLETPREQWLDEKAFSAAVQRTIDRHFPE